MADDPCEAALGSADPTGPRNYYRARYYDPKLGRFINEDPIRFRGGVNFFAYVLNNPVTLGDPFGLQAGDPKAASSTPPNDSRGFDFCTLSTTVIPPFNVQSVIITAPGAGQYDTYAGFSVGLPGCSATCSQIQGGPGNAKRAANFVKGASGGAGFFYGPGGTVTVSSTGQVSGDAGVGIGGKSAGVGGTWCWSCKSEEQKKYEANVKNIMRLLVGPGE